MLIAGIRPAKMGRGESCRRGDTSTLAPRAVSERAVRPAALLLITSGLLLNACESGVTDPNAQIDVRPHVTGAAAASLGPDGLFRYSEPSAPSTEPIISSERARELAGSFALSFGPALKHHWEQEHGRALEVTKLKADSRVFYQDTPYDLFPEGFHGAFRRMFGPYYLVRLSSGGQPRMSVAVSAYNTNLAIYPDGRLDRPFESGADFHARGLPVDTTRRDVVAPLTPEEAVVHVATMAGTRVSEVPRFVQLQWNRGPLGGAWKLTLERAVRVRVLSGGRTAEVRELYLGRESGRLLFIPAAEQPTYYPTGGLLSGDSDQWVKVDLPIRPGQPTEFEEVTVIPAI
jgi:hypothetical protein